jgi:hypothetical protein
MTAQGGLAKKRGTARQVGRAARAIHEHRAQVTLRTGMSGIGRDSIQPSRQNVVPREDGVASLEATCEFENRLSFTDGWR